MVSCNNPVTSTTSVLWDRQYVKMSHPHTCSSKKLDSFRRPKRSLLGWSVPFGALLTRGPDASGRWTAVIIVTSSVLSRYYTQARVVDASQSFLECKRPLTFDLHIQWQRTRHGAKLPVRGVSRGHVTSRDAFELQSWMWLGVAALTRVKRTAVAANVDP